MPAPYTDGVDAVTAAEMNRWSRTMEGGALSDEDTAVTTGQKLEIVLLYPMTIIEAFACNTVPSTSGVVTIDIKEGGVSVLSTLITIDANEKHSGIAAIPRVISDLALAQFAVVTFHIITAGTGAKGVKAWLVGRQTA